MSDLVYDIEKVFSSYLSEDGKTHYNIPEYQRGYKWSSVEVEKMLKDIKRFKPEEDKFYCLQNITIVPKENYTYYSQDAQFYPALSPIENAIKSVPVITN